MSNRPTYWWKYRGKSYRELESGELPKAGDLMECNETGEIWRLKEDSIYPARYGQRETGERGPNYWRYPQNDSQFLCNPTW